MGGHITALRRTAAGPFRIGGAKTLEELEADPEPTMTLDEECLACFPVRDVTADEGVALSPPRQVELP